MVRFSALVIAMGLLAGCNEENATGATVDQPDAQVAADVQVLEVAGEKDVLGQADVIAQPSPTDLPAWITGTWLECGGALTITAPDQAYWKAAGAACAVNAKIAWNSGQIDFTNVTLQDCTGTPPSWISTNAHASFDGTQLAIVQPLSFSGVKRFSRNPKRENWLLTASTGGSGNMRLCFDENGLFFDGGWTATTPDCHPIACGSVVAQVKPKGTETHIWTECQGGCPCASVLVAASKTATDMAGQFSSASCSTGEHGNFTAVIQPFPK